jgi:hypothetical protein
MAKKSRNVLPKRIAGVKVPKKARKGRFGELLVSPSGQAAIAEAARRYAIDQQAPAPAEDAGSARQTAGDGGWPELSPGGRDPLGV